MSAPPYCPTTPPHSSEIGPVIWRGNMGIVLGWAGLSTGTLDSV